MLSPSQEDGLVSVVIPVFNAARFLRATIASVRAQTYSNWEIVAAVDPGTSDDSIAVLEELAKAEPRLRVLKASGRGVSVARNLAIEHARGRYLAFLDADDVWMPSKLARQISWMRKLNLDFSATAFRRIDEQWERTGRLVQLPRQLSHRGLLRQNCICTSTVMVDRRRTGPIYFENVGCEDYELWLKLTARGLDGFGINEDLARYRVVRNSRGSSKWKTAKESWILIRKNAEFLPAVLRFGELLVRGAVKHSRF